MVTHKRKNKKTSYQIICEGNLGHIETAKVTFDILKITLKDILELFFEIHDIAQYDGQKC